MNFAVNIPALSILLPVSIRTSMFCSRCSGTLGVNERKSAVKSDFFHDVHRFQEILFRIPRKSYDDIRCDGRIR